MKWTSNEIALVSVSGTVAIAVFAAWTTYMATKRERRRVLYGQAVQAIVAWGEMLYRVRRREAGRERDLIDMFHDLQDKLAYHEAWIGSESKYMSRSYKRLVSSVKSATETLITKAWADEVRPVPGNAVVGDEHPNHSTAVDAFLRDVRAHLSPIVSRRLWMAYRNREQT
jgi:hypothetical protein